MKYGEVKLLMENSHITKMTAFTTNAQTAFKVFTLKRELEREYTVLSEKEKALLKEVGILESDISKEGKFIAPLDKEGNEDYSKFERFLKLRAELYESIIDLPLKKATFEEWFNICKENYEKEIQLEKGTVKVNICSEMVERFLENEFFEPTMSE